MEFKDCLILMFYNSKKKMLIHDMLKILGMTLKQLQDRTDNLIERGYVEVAEDTTVILTDIGKKTLLENNMSEIDILSTYSCNKKETNKYITPLSVNDIYIPKKFDKKVGK